MSYDDFKITLQPTADLLEVTVVGTLDEASVLSVPDPAGKPIRINGEGITRINSLGVSSWIRYMGRLRAFGVPVTVRMSVAMAIQASMISNFLADATIESFAAPYCCPSCEHVEQPIFAFRDEVPRSIPCPKCKKTMEFDDNIESFLNFRRAL